MKLIRNMIIAMDLGNTKTKVSLNSGDEGKLLMTRIYSSMIQKK